MREHLTASSIIDLATRLRAHETTARALVEEALAHIAERNPTFNAFITVLADAARAAAAAADAELAAGGDRGWLHGIPIAVKDLLDIEGVPTTAASRVRAGVVATRDATVVARLRRAGAIVIGKCNLHEFAYGTTGEDSAFGPTRNPYDLTRSAGGSSSGSAAAVAAGLVVASVGTDTGGSIRIPAAACGVVGLKPTYGVLPLDGVVPLSPSLDHVGPIARSVQDAWMLHQAMTGDTPPVPLASEELPPLGRVRLGVPRPYFFDVLDEDVRHQFETALSRLARAGCRIADVTIPHARYTMPIYLHVQLAEAATYHARTLETRAADYTPEVRARLELGRYVLAEDYLRAQRGRAVLQADVDRALAEYDALALPTLAIAAPPLGQPQVKIGDRIESTRTVMLRLTQAFNLTGHPALSLPCGWTREGLPCGLQLVGRRHGTAELVRLALACEGVVSSQGGESRSQALA